MCMSVIEDIPESSTNFDDETVEQMEAASILISMASGTSDSFQQQSSPQQRPRRPVRPRLWIPTESTLTMQTSTNESSDLENTTLPNRWAYVEEDLQLIRTLSTTFYKNEDNDVPTNSESNDQSISETIDAIAKNAKQDDDSFENDDSK